MTGALFKETPVRYGTVLEFGFSKVVYAFYKSANLYQVVQAGVVTSTLP